MTGVDRTAVVMSIQPVYANRLVIDRTKVWEFRKQPLSWDVRHVLVYRSGGLQRRGMVGHFTVLGQRKWTANELWENSKAFGLMEDEVVPSAGISPIDLGKYAGDWTTPLWGIRVGRVTAYDATIPLSVLGFDRGPQSWRFAPEGWRDMLRQGVSS